jgi:sensor histidine kinase regulating citrate/malate metabolism
LGFGLGRATHNGVVIIARHGRILVFNQAANCMLGDIKGEPVGPAFLGAESRHLAPSCT